MLTQNVSGCGLKSSSRYEGKQKSVCLKRHLKTVKTALTSKLFNGHCCVLFSPPYKQWEKVRMTTCHSGHRLIPEHVYWDKDKDLCKPTACGLINLHY